MYCLRECIGVFARCERQFCVVAFPLFLIVLSDLREIAGAIRNRFCASYVNDNAQEFYRQSFWTVGPQRWLLRSGNLGAAFECEERLWIVTFSRPFSPRSLVDVDEGSDPQEKQPQRQPRGSQKENRGSEDCTSILEKPLGGLENANKIENVV